MALAVVVSTLVLALAVLSSLDASMATTVVAVGFMQFGLVASAMYVRGKAEAGSRKKTVATWVAIVAAFWALMSLIAFLRG